MYLFDKTLVVCIQVTRHLYVSIGQDTCCMYPGNKTLVGIYWTRHLLYVSRWQDICVVLQPGGKTQYVEGINLQHNLDLISACGYPACTNYVTGFSGCLDYIYISANNLKTSRIVPLPTHDEVTQHTALPNILFPSDHLALVCDITWTLDFTSKL